MKYTDWINEDNLFPVLIVIASLCDCKFDEDDKAAIEAGLRKISGTKGLWFEYVFAGNGEITIAVFKESGSSDYDLRVASELDIEQAVKMAISFGQQFQITEKKRY